MNQIKNKFNIQQIREGLRHCLVTRECSKCPYFIYYYNNDIKEIGDNSCWGILQKDADLALQRFSIIDDNGVD